MKSTALLVTSGRSADTSSSVFALSSCLFLNALRKFGDIENLDLDKLSDEIIQTVADMVMDVYLALGGTSKAAKSYAMASKVKEKISLLLP